MKKYSKSLTEKLNSDNQFVYLTPADVAEILGCSIVQARKIFKRDDFPLLKLGKNFKVSKQAFFEWTQTQRK